MTRPAEYRRRREDYPLITGHGRYVDDVRVPEGRPAIFHMAVVRSPYAHAIIDRIDLDAARALPGVVAALSGAELVAGMPTLSSIPFPELKQPERRPMAADRVRYVGDPVAVVLAEDLYTALDARYLVEVDYTPLPAVSDPEAALALDAPVLYDELGTNVAFSLHSQWGDVDRVFEQAEHTVRLRLVNPRLAPSSLEPRACLFDFDTASGILSAWLSSQSVFRARDALSHMLGLLANCQRERKLDKDCYHKDNRLRESPTDEEVAMSLKPEPIDPVPEETARIARAAFPKGNLYLRLRDELGTLYQDDLFADLFPSRGQPAEAPWRLALVTIMQFLEGLSDRQAAEAVRSRLDWKYLLGLEATDAGFHYSVLCEFRSRLLAGEAEHRLFEVLLTHFQARGWLKQRQRQRTDSTHIVAAVRSLNRLELVGRTLQHALNTLAEVAPDWLLTQIGPEWFERYSRPLDEYRLPKEKAERLALAEQIGKDGHHLLLSIAQAHSAPLLEKAPAIVTLRQVWQQQYDLEASPIQWRPQEALPPSGERIATPHDPEARYSTKRSVTWVGYKVHLTETCEQDAPHVITHVETALATEGDSTALPRIHEALAKRELLPGEHLVDTTYGSGDLLASSQTEYGVELICPVRPDQSWQAQEQGAFGLDDFRIDWEGQQVSCPQGKISRHWKSEQGPRGKPTIQVQFHKADCLPCPVRAQCTRSTRGPRELTLHPREAHLAIQAARVRQETPGFKECYDKRAGVEGTISQTVCALDMRRSRYIGLAKTHLQQVLTATAINLLRAVAWLEEIPFAKMRRSSFAALCAA